MAMGNKYVGGFEMEVFDKENCVIVSFWYDHR